MIFDEMKGFMSKTLFWIFIISISIVIINMIYTNGMRKANDPAWQQDRWENSEYTGSTRKITSDMIHNSSPSGNGINVWNSPCREKVICLISKAQNIRILGRDNCDGNEVYHIETETGCQGYISTIQLDNE